MKRFIATSQFQSTEHYHTYNMEVACK